MIDAPEVFALTHAERNTGLWVKLLKHLNDQLTSLRAKNDGAHDALATAGIRGQIAAYKALIDLDKDLPVID